MAAATAMMVVSAAITAYSAVRAGQAQSQAAKYNQQIATQNATIAQQQGAAQATALHRKQVQQIGAAQAAFGASGVSSDSGSVADVLGDSIRQGTLDQLTAKYNAQVGAAGFQDNASLDQMNASNAMTSSYLSAAGAAANGAGQAYKMQSGGFGYGFGS